MTVYDGDLLSDEDVSEERQVGVECGQDNLSVE
jgi:hypothetical protein